MQKPLSNSVKIIYFPKEAVWQALRALAREMPEKYPEIGCIVVFGSLVRGDAVPGSDVDLLIILRESNLPFLDRIPQYMPERFPVGVDIFPYTEEEIDRMRKEGHLLLKQALETGILLYQRS